MLFLVLPHAAAGAPAGASYDWQPEDVAALKDVQVVLAADCIYDDDITLAFMQCMERFLQPRDGCAGACPILPRAGLQRHDLATFSHQLGLCPERGAGMHRAAAAGCS